jgi:hypothetical protein
LRHEAIFTAISGAFDNKLTQLDSYIQWH